MKQTHSNTTESRHLWKRLRSTYKAMQITKDILDVAESIFDNVDTIAIKRHNIPIFIGPIKFSASLAGRLRKKLDKLRSLNYDLFIAHSGLEDEEVP